MSPNFFLDVAETCARQGTCLRRNFGSVIVDEFNTIVSTGFTGAARGKKHCSELGECYRIKNNIASGSDYTKCRSIHSEINALIQAGVAARNCDLYLCGIEKVSGKKYLSILPCYMCIKTMVNAGINSVFIRTAKYKYALYTAEEIYELREREALPQ